MNDARYSDSIGIVTVFFNPSDAAVESFVNLAGIYEQVVIANNGMSPQQLARLRVTPRLIVVGDGSNKGLAKGLNQAIEALFDLRQIKYIFMLDQDSLPTIDLAEKLTHSFVRLSESARLAAIGPRITDVKAAAATAVRDGGYSFVQGLATSGTLTSVAVVKSVGLLQEELFIDCLDHEWCFRARALGYEIAIDESISMLHDMGESGLSFFGTFKPVYRSPTRHYYIVRNTIVLLGLRHVPLPWKITEALKTVRRVIFYILVSTDRAVTISNVSRGIVHGVSGRLGPIH
jgi:rhamnosyltransferase